MNSVYPTESKSNGPPTYEQVMPSTQVPSITNATGTFSTHNMAYPMQAPPIGMYPGSVMILPPNAQPIGTNMLITTRSLLYGDIPVQCVCPNCSQTICTRIEKRTGLLPWIICGGFLIMGCWLGCCLIPFCIDSLQDTEHYCPNCAVQLGTRRRI